MQTPDTELTGAYENRASSLLFDSDTDDVAVPQRAKI
jgi:hypothetical protein